MGGHVHFRYGTKFDTITMTLWTPLSFQYNFHFTPKRGHFILAINIFCINFKGFLQHGWNETIVAFFCVIHENNLNLRYTGP